MPTENSQDNLSGLVRERWPESLITLLVTAGEVARGLNYRLYAVGGAVRDLLLGRPNLDLDLVVEGNGVEVARQLAARLGAKVVIHGRFGTAKLYYQGGSLDIITARREEYPHPGALPIVQPSNLEADLLRRDFTINTLAIRVEPVPFGELVDPYGGRQDLDNHLIRILHPKSFTDDATRILRALRYEQRLGFQLEKGTAEAMRRDVAMLDTISGDRLRHELESILKESYPERVMSRLVEIGAVSRLLPSWKREEELESRMARARHAGASPSLYMALFIYPLELPDVESIISRFHFPATTAQILRQTVELRGKLLPLNRPGLLSSHIYGQLKGYSPTAILANALATSLSPASQNLHLYLDTLRHVKPSLTGEDLIRMGVAPGPGLGQLLERLLEAKLNGEATGREEEERLVRSWLSA